MSESKTLERIAALLAKAENTDNEHEADAFMTAAQRLATTHDIDMQRARMLAGKRNASAKPEQRDMVIGVAGTRGLSTLVRLASGIATAQDVQMDIAHNSTRVYFFGFGENIDVVERLYASLVVQMASALARHKKEGSWREDTMTVPGRYRWVDERTGKPCTRWDYYGTQEWVPTQTKPITWQRARLDFQEAFASRIGHRLYVAKAEAVAKAREDEEAAVAAEPEAPEQAVVGTDLVLADKRKVVRDFYKEQSRARGFYKGYRNEISRTGGLSRAAGRKAADSARLGGERELPGARKGIAS